MLIKISEVMLPDPSKVAQVDAAILLKVSN